jgi:hypothetical protein
MLVHLPSRIRQRQAPHQTFPFGSVVLRGLRFLVVVVV